jgi:hypothetical protein
VGVGVARKRESGAVGLDERREGEETEQRERRERIYFFFIKIRIGCLQ